MNREPLVTRAVITSVISAIVTLLVSFNVPISDKQQSAIVGIVAVVAPLVVALVSRHKVTPAE